MFNLPQDELVVPPNRTTKFVYPIKDQVRLEFICPLHDKELFSLSHYLLTNNPNDEMYVIENRSDNYGFYKIIKRSEDAQYGQ